MMIDKFVFFSKIGFWNLMFYELTCNCFPTKQPVSELPKCNSFVFFDIEATGVPYMERRGKTRISEISFVAISRDEFYKEYNGLPRVLPKLTVLTNPERKISYATSRLTGLNNFLLRNEYPFDERKATLIGGFLEQCKSPVCLVAHNGIRFDLPLLKEELLKYKNIIPNNTRCVDSLSAFRKLKTLTVGTKSKATTGSEVVDPKKIKGFKLEDVFLRLFGKEAKFNHRAEYDTLVLIQCCLKLGQPILDWFDENSVSYSAIKPTYHKKRNQTAE